MSVIIATKLTYQEYKLFLQAMRKHKKSRYALLRSYALVGLSEEFGEERMEKLDGAKKEVEGMSIADIIASQQVRRITR